MRARASYAEQIGEPRSFFQRPGWIYKVHFCRGDYATA